MGATTPHNTGDHAQWCPVGFEYFLAAETVILPKKASEILIFRGLCPGAGAKQLIWPAQRENLQNPQFFEHISLTRMGPIGVFSEHLLHKMST